MEMQGQACLWSLTTRSILEDCPRFERRFPQGVQASEPVPCLPCHRADRCYSKTLTVRKQSHACGVPAQCRGQACRRSGSSLPISKRGHFDIRIGLVSGLISQVVAGSAKVPIPACSFLGAWGHCLGVEEGAIWKPQISMDHQENRASFPAWRCQCN